MTFDTRSIELIALAQIADVAAPSEPTADAILELRHEARSAFDPELRSR